MYKYKIITYNFAADPLLPDEGGVYCYGYILYDDHDTFVKRSSPWYPGDIGSLHLDAIRAIQEDKKLKPWR